ncbi:MAG: DUF2100 domain-containing protein [Promethearchaeota archaeon]
MEKKIRIENVKALLTAIDDLIEIKLLIRSIVPSYTLDENLNEKFNSLLKSLQNKLQPLFSEYLTKEILIKTKDSAEQIKTKILKILKSDNIGLISANSSKKKLKTLGVDPRRLIVTGGPISIKDYKIINPDLPDKALSGIKTKYERLINQINSENWENKDLVFIYEKENPTDKLILNRIEEISNIIQKKVILLELNSWKDFDK